MMILTLQNTGTAASANLPSTIQTNNHTVFVYLAGGTCVLGAPLAGSSACTLFIQFQPTSFGTTADNLSFSVGGSTVSTSLIATGQQTFMLTVMNMGATGTDQVTSTPTNDIVCGDGVATCSKSYVVTAGPAPTVMLSPGIGANSRFVGFSGPDCSGPTCSLTMNANHTQVVANWQATFVATVTFAGNGSGTVTSTSSPTQTSQFNCSGTCSVTFDTNMTVTATASPAPGTTFSDWSMGCSGSGSCSLSSGTPSTTVNFTSPCAVANASDPQFVDPNLGTDDAFHGNAAGSCAYKTITYALTRATGEIDLTNATYSALETFPLTLTGGQMLNCEPAGAAGPATISGGAGSTNCNTIYMTGAGNTVENCLLSPGGTSCPTTIFTVDYTGAGVITNNTITGGISASGSVAIEVLGSNYVSISGNTITGGYYGILWMGSSPQTGSMGGNIISGVDQADIYCQEWLDPNVVRGGSVNTLEDPGTCGQCSNCGSF